MIGLLGFVVVGMLVVFMFMNDSYLLCWVVVIVEDVVNLFVDEKFFI